ITVMSGSLSLCEDDLTPLLDSDTALEDGGEQRREEEEREEEERRRPEGEEEARLLRKVASQTISLFDMPHRSVSSTVTMCPSMHFSWHNVSAQTLDNRPSSSPLPFLKRASTASCSTTVDIEKRPDQKWILNEVFGVAQPGEVLAIMGSSGAGKTTLLNILAHRNTNGMEVEGAIKVNGLRVTKDFMQKISAYVEQEDAFIGSLTVREQLRFVASLRMGKRYTRKEQERRVESVMKDLGLLPSADTVIRTKYRSMLSGGEKKRLAFAAEILTSPPLLLCDEPTSGLDAFLAFQVVSVLKSLARSKGMTILLTIHQPSSQVFALFDRIYLMSEGRVAFSGTPAQARETWTRMGRPLPLNFNPADHYINTLAITNGPEESRQRREVKRITDSFALSPEGRTLQREARTGEVRKDSEMDEMRSSEQGAVRNRMGGAGGGGTRGEERYKSTWFQQVRALTWRGYKTIIRDPSLLKTQMIQAILIAVLTGIIYVGTPLNQDTVMNVNGAIFQNINNQAFLFVFSGMLTLNSELPVFHREHTASLYRTSAYFLARNLAEFIPYTIYSIVFSSILYWMSGLVADGFAFLIYVVVSALIMHVAISCSYLVACIFTSRAVCGTVLPVFTVPATAFSGFYINVSSLPFYFLPLKYLSYFAYAYEALAANQWTRIETIPGCPAANTTCFHNGEEVLESMTFRASNMYWNMGILALMIVGIRLIAFGSLWLKSRRH
ncbi:wht-7, partial [Pristionchus pacificus]